MSIKIQNDFFPNFFPIIFWRQLQEFYCKQFSCIKRRTGLITGDSGSTFVSKTTPDSFWSKNSKTSFLIAKWPVSGHQNGTFKNL